MRFRFRCPNSASKYSIRFDQAGKSGKCKHCGAILRVPHLDPQFGDDATADLTTATVGVTIGGPLAFIRRFLGM